MVIPFVVALGALAYFALLPSTPGTAILGAAACLVMLVSAAGMVWESLKDG